MKTLIKRSIKIALVIAFIGVAVVPACAQNRFLILLLPQAGGKTRATIGKGPFVRNLVVPPVSPTLKGNPVLTHKGRESLERALQTTITKRVIPPILAPLSPFRGDGFVDDLMDYADKHGVSDPGYAIAWINRITEKTDAAFFKNKGEGPYKRYKRFKTYEAAWLYSLSIEEDLFLQELLKPFTLSDSPLRSFFELRQQQLEILNKR